MIEGHEECTHDENLGMKPDFWGLITRCMNVQNCWWYISVLLNMFQSCVCVRSNNVQRKAVSAGFRISGLSLLIRVPLCIRHDFSTVFYGHNYFSLECNASLMFWMVSSTIVLHTMKNLQIDHFDEHNPQRNWIIWTKRFAKFGN